MPVLQRSVDKADCCRCLSQWPGKNNTWPGSHQWNSGCWHRLWIRFWGDQFWEWFWIGGRRWGSTASLSRNRNTGCSEWWITNLGTTSRKEHKYSSFCQSSERCEKKWGSTHQQRQLTTVCVDVFHRNFSSAGWTDQRVIPATLRQTSWT